MKRWTASRVLASARTFLLRPKNESSGPTGEGAQAPPGAHWEYPVLGYAALVERTNAVAAIDRLRIQLGFPREVFDQTARPVIEAYVQFVQLLPAPQSPAHLHAGGLITRAIEVANRALDYRRGQILPRSAAPEVIGAQAHRWTYAVFVAALLHGIGAQLARLSVLIRDGQGALRTWSPIAGSLADCGAVSYRVTILDRPESPHTLAPSGVLQLLYRFVPAPVLAWMTEDPDLMPELAAVLAGTPSGSTGAIGELIARASLNEGSSDRPITAKAQESDPPAVTTADSVDRDAPALGAVTRAHPDGTGPDARSRSDEEPAQDFHERSATPNLDSTLPATSDVAGRFIAWLQQGIVGNRLRINDARALVHFVPEGMLLISPRIFREFVAQVGVGKVGYPLPLIPDSQHIAKWVQRRVLRAGWHLQAEGDLNILTYEVIRADRAVSTLSGVVILDPGRFIKPLPPMNPFLVRQISARRDG